MIASVPLPRHTKSRQLLGVLIHKQNRLAARSLGKLSYLRLLHDIPQLRNGMLAKTPPTASEVDVVAPQQVTSEVQYVGSNVVSHIRSANTRQCFNPCLGKKLAKNYVVFPVVFFLQSP